VVKVPRRAETDAVAAGPPAGPVLSPVRLLGLSIFLPSAFMAIGQMALVVVLPLYIVERGAGVAVAALVFAMRGFGSMLVNVPASVAIARWGHKTSLLCGTGVMCLAALMVAIASSTWVVGAATLLFGAGMGTWLLARLAYITEKVPNHQRGTAMSVLAGLQRLGMLLGPLLGGLGVASVGYRVVFVSIAASALLTVGLIWMFVPAAAGRPSQPARPPTSTANGSPAYGLLALVPRMLRRHRTIFVTAGVFVFCLQLVREQRRLLVILWGTTIGIEVDDIGLIVSVASVVDMAMFPVAGYIMDHRGRKLAGVGCLGILAVAMGLLPLTSTPTSYLFVTVLAGIGNGLGSGIILTMGSDLAPARETSQFLGVWRMVGDLGAFVGPLLTAVAASLVIALGVSSIIGLSGAAVLFFCVPETLSSERHR